MPGAGERRAGGAAELHFVLGFLELGDVSTFMIVFVSIVTSVDWVDGRYLTKQRGKVLLAQKERKETERTRRKGGPWMCVLCLCLFVFVGERVWGVFRSSYSPLLSKWS